MILKYKMGTPIIRKKKEELNEPSAQFSTPMQVPMSTSPVPRQMQNQITPVNVKLPMGTSQGEGNNNQEISIKEYFYNYDFFNAIIVFIILIIFTNSFFYSFFSKKANFLVSIEGKPTHIGNIIFSFIGVLLFILLSFIVKKFR